MPRKSRAPKYLRMVDLPYPVVVAIGHGATVAHRIMLANGNDRRNYQNFLQLKAAADNLTEVMEANGIHYIGDIHLDVFREVRDYLGLLLSNEENHRD